MQQTAERKQVCWQLTQTRWSSYVASSSGMSAAARPSDGRKASPVMFRTPLAYRLARLRASSPRSASSSRSSIPQLSNESSFRWNVSVNRRRSNEKTLR